MPKMMSSVSRRVSVAFLLYATLVLVAGLAFYFMRQEVQDGSLLRYAYLLFGPALSLFTHMSYFLFLLQSLLLIPWLLLGAIWTGTAKWAAVGFCVFWLSIGWYMHDLF